MPKWLSISFRIALKDSLTKAVGGVLEILKVLLHQTVSRAAQNGPLEDGILGDETVNQRVHGVREREDRIGNLPGRPAQDRKSCQQGLFRR